MKIPHQMTLHEILYIIKESKNSEEIREATLQFKERMSLEPSDEFLSEIITEIVNNKDGVGDYASVLLFKDIQKSGDDGLLQRLSNFQTGHSMFSQLLQHCAGKPNMKLMQVISEYAIYAIKNGQEFDSVFEFLEQGYKSKNIQVVRMASYLGFELCKASVSVIQQFKVNMLEFLQQCLSNDDEETAQYAVSALIQMVMNNQTDEKIIPEEVEQQIFDAIPLKIAQFTDEQMIIKSLKRMVAFLSLSHYQWEFDATAIFQMVQHFLQGENKDLTYYSLLILQELMMQKQIKAQLLDESLVLIKQAIFREMQPDETFLENWRVNHVINDVNSYQMKIGDIFKNLFVTLGKNQIYPMMAEYMEFASQSNDQFVTTCCCLAISNISSVIRDVLKKNEQLRIVEVLCGIIQSSQELMPIQAAFCALEELIFSFSAAFNKYHSQLMPIFLNSIQYNDQFILIQALDSLLQFTGFMKYQTFFSYLSQLDEVVSFCISHQEMSVKTVGLKFLTQFCEVLDSQDLIIKIEKYISLVFSQFSSIIEVFQEEVEFDKTQSDYIRIVISMLSKAILKLPKEFKEYIDQICSNMTHIIKKCHQQKESAVMVSAIEFLQLIVPDNSTEVTPYLQDLLQLFVTVLQESPIQKITDLKQGIDEEMVFNEDLSNEHKQILMLLSSTADVEPKVFEQCFSELVTLLQEYETPTEDLTFAWMMMVAQIPHIAAGLGLDIESVHLQVFELFTNPLTNQKNKQNIMLTSLESLKDAADSLFYYVKYFLLHAVPNQYQSLPAFITKVFEILDWMFDKALILATSQLELTAGIDTGTEEQIACAQDVYDQFSEIIEQLGYCYVQIIEKYKNYPDLNVFKQVTERALGFMSRDLSQSINQFVYSQGADIYAKFASELPKELVSELFEPVLPLMFDVLQKYHNQKIISASAYYCFLEYLQKTEDSRVSGLLENAKKTLIWADEEEQMEVFNNVCSFMVLCGFVLQMESDFWASILEFVQKMEEDEYEQIRIIKYLMLQFPKIDDQNVQVVCIQTICKFFFGDYHETFLTEPIYANQTALVNQFFKEKAIKEVAKAFVETDEILAKNAKHDGL